MSNPAEESTEESEVFEVPAEFEDEDPDSLVGEPVEDDGLPADDED